MKENKIDLKILPGNLQGEALLKTSLSTFNRTDCTASSIWTLSEWRTAQNVNCCGRRNS